MNRLPHRQDFKLRLAFSDSDGLPVNMKGVDVDMWFYTRPGSSAYLSAARSGICNRCSVLDDGSLLVTFDDHKLPAGQLHAEIAIHADDETMPDGTRDIHFKPAIPIELTDTTCPPRPGHALQQSGQPILVNITIPISRPNLSHHITQDELDKAIQGIKDRIDDIQPCNLIPATDKQIADIASMFATGIQN